MNSRVYFFLAYDYKDVTRDPLLDPWNKLLVIQVTFDSSCLL